MQWTPCWSEVSIRNFRFKLSIKNSTRQAEAQQKPLHRSSKNAVTIIINVEKVSLLECWVRLTVQAADRKEIRAPRTDTAKADIQVLNPLSLLSTSRSLLAKGGQ